MLPTKSRAAFEFSVNRLLREYGKLYFWTFTFKEVPYSDDKAMEDWNAYMKRVTKHWPDLRGLRVCELHKSHGIHFHAIVNRYLNVRVLRKLAYGTGRISGRFRYLDFGRNHVCVAKPESIAYLAKYMTKQYREKNGWYRRRSWGTIGGFDHTRVNDVEYDTPETRNLHKLQKAYGWKKLSYTGWALVRAYTVKYGDISDWPAECRALVNHHVFRPKRQSAPPDCPF
jgi:hypothetical protein